MKNPFANRKKRKTKDDLFTASVDVHDDVQGNIEKLSNVSDIETAQNAVNALMAAMQKPIISSTPMGDEEKIVLPILNFEEPEDWDRYAEGLIGEYVPDEPDEVFVPVEQDTPDVDHSDDSDTPEEEDSPLEDDGLEEEIDEFGDDQASEDVAIDDSLASILTSAVDQRVPDLTAGNVSDSGPMRPLPDMQSVPANTQVSDDTDLDDELQSKFQPDPLGVAAGQAPFLEEDDDDEFIVAEGSEGDSSHEVSDDAIIDEALGDDAPDYDLLPDNSKAGPEYDDDDINPNSFSPENTPDVPSMKDHDDAEMLSDIAENSPDEWIDHEQTEEAFGGSDDLVMDESDGQIVEEQDEPKGEDDGLISVSFDEPVTNESATHEIPDEKNPENTVDPNASEQQGPSEKNKSKGWIFGASALAVAAGLAAAAAYFLPSEITAPRMPFGNVNAAGPMASKDDGIVVAQTAPIAPQDRPAQPLTAAMPTENTTSDRMSEELQSSADLDQTDSETPVTDEDLQQDAQGRVPEIDFASPQMSNPPSMPEFGDDMRLSEDRQTAPDVVENALDRLSGSDNPSDEATAEQVAELSSEDTEERPQIDPEFLAQVAQMGDTIEALRDQIDDMSEEIEALRSVNGELSQSYAALENLVAQNTATRSLVNQQLPKMFELEDELDNAELLFVSMGDRLNALEQVNVSQEAKAAAEEVSEVSLLRLEGRLDQLNTNIGIIARMAAQTAAPAPYTMMNTPQAPVTQPGAVFASPQSAVQSIAQNTSESFILSNKAQPSLLDASIGDTVEGYGQVLRIMPAQGGGKILVMENGSIFVD